MKNQKLRNLVKKSNLMEQAEDFSVISNIHSQVLKGGGNGACDKTIIKTFDDICGINPPKK